MQYRQKDARGDLATTVRTPQMGTLQQSPLSVLSAGSNQFQRNLNGTNRLFRGRTPVRPPRRASCPRRTEMPRACWTSGEITSPLLNVARAGSRQLNLATGFGILARFHVSYPHAGLAAFSFSFFSHTSFLLIINLYYVHDCWRVRAVGQSQSYIGVERCTSREILWQATCSHETQSRLGQERLRH
jgi:hypothetical protein